MCEAHRHAKLGGLGRRSGGMPPPGKFLKIRLSYIESENIFLGVFQYFNFKASHHDKFHLHTVASQ